MSQLDRLRTLSISVIHTEKVEAPGCEVMHARVTYILKELWACALAAQVTCNVLK